MSRVVFREDRCKGCLICTLVCPKKIITPSNRLNQQGYKPAEVVAEAMKDCTGCASCAEICPDYAITVFREKSSKGGASDVVQEA